MLLLEKSNRSFSFAAMPMQHYHPVHIIHIVTLLYNFLSFFIPSKKLITRRSVRCGGAFTSQTVKWRYRPSLSSYVTKKEMNEKPISSRLHFVPLLLLFGLLQSKMTISYILATSEQRYICTTISKYFVKLWRCHVSYCHSNVVLLAKCCCYCNRRATVIHIKTGPIKRYEFLWIYWKNGRLKANGKQPEEVYSTIYKDGEREKEQQRCPSCASARCVELYWSFIGNRVVVYFQEFMSEFMWCDECLLLHTRLYCPVCAYVCVCVIVNNILFPYPPAKGWQRVHRPNNDVHTPWIVSDSACNTQTYNISGLLRNVLAAWICSK